MEELLLSLTSGNVSEVKIVLATVVALLAAYQVGLMAVGYGKVRLPFLQPPPASKAHRAIGDSIVAVTLVVAVMCIGYFGFEDDAAVHILLACALLAVLGFKVLVVRRLHRLGHLLPTLGIAVFLLFWATWLSAAAEHLL
jgi:Na+/H+ antiporter NhaA